MDREEMLKKVSDFFDLWEEEIAEATDEEILRALKFYVIHGPSTALAVLGKYM